MLSLITFFLVLGVLILIHEFGHFIAAKKVGVKVEEFSLGFGPKLLGRKKGDSEYMIKAIPLGGYVKLAGDNQEEYKGNPDEYLSKKPSQRAAIIFSGPLLNYIMGFIFFWFIFFTGYPTLTTKIGGLLDGYGAKEANLLIGDKIIGIDEKPVSTWEDMQIIIHSKKAPSVVRLSILRDNKKYTIDVKVKEGQVDDQLGQKRSIGLLGITPSGEFIKIRHGLIESLYLSAKKTWTITAMTYTALWRMITGKMSARDSMTGPLGIFYMTSQVAQIGPIAVLHFIAVLSLSLAIFNLLPFPVLDGGHILFLIIEKIRGRYLSLKAERIVTRIGMTVLLSVVLLVTYNDILRLFGDKLSKLFK